MDRHSFWGQLNEFAQWQSEHFPSFDSQEGKAVLVWLTTNGADCHPVGRLLQSSVCSDQTLLAVISQYKAAGLVKECNQGTDGAQIQRTAAFEALLFEYRKGLKALAAIATQQ